jgi:hypothetical protein
MPCFVQTKRYARIMAVMARESWTDERLDDLKEQMNERFDQVDKEMNQRFDRVEADVREIRQTMNLGIGIMVTGFLTLGGLIVTLGGIMVL